MIVCSMSAEVLNKYSTVMILVTVHSSKFVLDILKLQKIDGVL